MSEFTVPERGSERGPERGPFRGGPDGWGEGGGAEVPFGTARAPRVAVSGEARLEFDPEVARIGVTVRARGSDRRAALEDLTRRNAQVLELVKSYGPAVEKLSTGAFSVAPEMARRARGERVRTYHGAVHVSVTVSDFAALGELVTRLAEVELAEVGGPWWALRPDSVAYRETRQQAVREAVTRAREYAGAVGSRLTALVELADENAEAPAPVMPRSRLAAAAAPGGLFGGAEEAAPALDLEPQRQAVWARVNARFTMSPPVL